MMLRKIKGLNMDKKGDFTSLIVMIAIVFALAISIIIFSKVFLLVTSELKDTGEFSDRTIDTIELVEDRTIPLLDFFIFFTLISLMIGLIISSIYIDTHPVFTVIFGLALIIGVFIAGQLANIYNVVTENVELASTAAQFSLTNLIFQHLALWILGIGVIIAIILFGKSKSQGTTI